MTRRQRQLDELRALCSTGAIARAIDLAYEHFADFGLDDDIAVLISEAMEQVDVTASTRSKFTDLLASHQ